VLCNLRARVFCHFWQAKFWFFLIDSAHAAARGVSLGITQQVDAVLPG
jgi:hypothetical protein